jgi:hypothetical protein
LSFLCALCAVLGLFSAVYYAASGKPQRTLRISQRDAERIELSRYR